MADFPVDVTATDPNELLGSNSTVPAKTSINALGRDIINSTAAGIRNSLRIDQRTAVADTNYTAVATDRLISYTSITAPRVVTLPAGSVFQVGQELIINDEGMQVTLTNTITITPSGGELIDGAATEVIAAAGGMRRVFRTPTGWSFDKGVLRSSGNLADVGNVTTARNNLLAAASTSLVSQVIEEFMGLTPFQGGLVSAVAGGGAVTQRNGGSANEVGIIELSTGTTSGASALGRIVNAPAAGTTSVRFGATINHFFGYKVAAGSLPGTASTDDSHLLVGLGTSGSSIGTSNVEFVCTNADNWVARIISGTTGSFDTGLPARVTVPSCGTTNAGVTVTVPNTTGLSLGMPFFGPGIPNGAMISGIVPNTNITITIAATATATVTCGAGIWYNLGIFYKSATGRIQFYNGLTLLGEIGPGSTTPGTNTTQALPTAVFPRMMAFREDVTTSDFRLMVDTYIHRMTYAAQRWPAL